MIKKRRNKYGAIKTQVDGIWFDSKGEARRYRELEILQKVGEISDLKLQVTFKIKVLGKHICKYRADFTYRDEVTETDVVEDFKGKETNLFKLKWKLMEALYGQKYDLRISREK